MASPSDADVPTPAVSALLVATALDIGRRCSAAAVFVRGDALTPALHAQAETAGPRLIAIDRAPAGAPDSASAGPRLAVPDVPLSRTGQVKLALLLALSRGTVEPDDLVVCVTGSAAGRTLDTVVVTRVRDELNLGATGALDSAGLGLPPDIRPAVLERVLDLTVELGTEGREGHPVGALFVVGDHERVRSMSRQLILNPFHGYPAAARSILARDLEETVKELSTLDGAFIVRGDGVIEAAGAYLKTAAQDQYHLPQGLGARHHAAAAITAVTDAVAVSVSHSTGTVTVFRAGRIVAEIEKLRATGRAGAR